MVRHDVFNVASVLRDNSASLAGLRLPCNGDTRVRTLQRACAVWARSIGPSMLVLSPGIFLVAVAGCSAIQPELSIHAQQAQAWTCERIAKNIVETIEKMKALKAQAEKEKQDPPSTVVRAYRRIFGAEGAGNAAHEEYQRQRTHADQLNAALIGKGCATIDLDARPAFSTK